MMFDNEAVRHWRRMGEKSGLPSCCVEFFCFAWRGYNKAARHKYFAEMESKGYPGGYVPCPTHLNASKIVTQISHRCPHGVMGCGYTVRAGLN